MKKANKKLASAIVLGLMLAVPVGVSAAASTLDEATVITVSGSAHLDKKSDSFGNVVFKAGIADDATTGDQPQIVLNNGDSIETTISSTGTMKIDGNWKQGAFYVTNGSTINVDAVNIETVGTGSAFIFDAWEGTINVTAEENIKMEGSGLAFGANRAGSNGTDSKVIVSAENVNVNTEKGIWVANNRADGSGSSTVDITATGEQGINITGSEYAIQAEKGEGATGKEYVNLTANEIVVNGAINALKGADLTVTVDGNGTLTGAVVSDDTSSVDINTKGGDFTWNLTGDSTVDVFQAMDSTADITSTINGNGYNLTVNDAVEGRHGDTVDIKNVNNIYINKEANPEGIDYNIFYANLDGKDVDTSTINFDITGNLQTVMDETSNSQMFTARGGSITGHANNIIVNNVKDGIGADASAASGSDIAKDGSVTLTADTDIDIRTDNGFTVYARANNGNGKDGNKGTVNLTAGNNITLVSNLETLGNATVSVLGTDFDHESSISMNAGNKLTIINQKVDGDTVEYGTAIRVQNATGEKVTSVTAAGKEIEIKGDIEAANNTNVVIGNADNSSVINFTGAVTDNNVSGAEGQSLYSADDNGVVFNMAKGSVLNFTDDSTFTAVNGEGTVALAVSKTDSDNPAYTATTVTGNTQGAQLTLTAIGKNAGNVANLDEAEAIFSALKTGMNSGNTAGVIGMELKETISDAAITANSDGTNVQQAQYSSTEANMRDIASVALVAWRQEDSTLSQRLGELRNSEGDQGIWARMSRGEFEYDGAFKNQYNYFQLGYDWAAKDWHYGAAISHNDGQTTYANGSGENDSTSLTLYGTWLGNEGKYADIVVKQGKLNNEFTNYAEAGITTGDYDMWGTSISAEYGQKLEMENDWYVTPQAQLTYMRIGGEDYTATVATKAGNEAMYVSQDGMDSFVGRIGFEAGKNISEKGSIYAKASLLHEFAGEADTTFLYGNNPGGFSQDLGDTWYECGFGVNYKTSDNSYVYADVVKTFGGDVETPWQWNAGMRWSF